LLSQKVFASFNPRLPGDSLADLAISLLKEQKSKWRQLADGYESLDSVKVREIYCDGFSTWLQFNPKRIISTSANVDDKSIRERKCFLCLENLPDEQKGVLYRDEFLILCNPAPIFSRHFTISTVRHTRQEIGKFIGTLLSLSKELSPEFIVFYNGPRCGASAPDHMHFQASPSWSIPVERDAGDVQRRVLRKKEGAVSFLTLRRYGRQVLLLESEVESELESSFLNLISVMQRVAQATEEPMLNLLCSYQKNAWRVIIFPRRKHRPDVYFREGEARVLISPAAVDIGGLVVTPVERDYERVDAKMIENIFEEVSVDQDVLEKIVNES
jgi:ATP adenylyltransferase/5',5'''-P-1,P-4-tetraphosphate phosphorylase II